MTIENLQFVMPASFKCPRYFYIENNSLFPAIKISAST